MAKVQFGVTPRQGQVLAFLRQRQADGLAAPTLQEIADAIGCRSKGHVSDFLAGLEARGHIRRIPGAQRSVALVEVANG
ncbi:MAG: MarR family transcriptional regulator [Desulfobulbaceae bacterium]|nr:MAG: MarR family transcriptional regulator [Desulfobulbaceae bacterium]